MDRDGVGTGYDIPLLSAITSRVRVPVVASGGAGNLGDLVSAVRDGGVSAVLAASIFHFGTHTLAEARDALRQAGAPIRII
jgi:cyclase